MPFFLQVVTNLPAHHPQVTKYRAIHNVFGHAFQLFIPPVHYYFVHPTLKAIDTPQELTKIYNKNPLTPRSSR